MKKFDFEKTYYVFDKHDGKLKAVGFQDADNPENYLCLFVYTNEDAISETILNELASCHFDLINQPVMDETGFIALASFVGPEFEFISRPMEEACRIEMKTFLEECMDFCNIPQISFTSTTEKKIIKFGNRKIELIKEPFDSTKGDAELVKRLLGENVEGGETIH